MSNVDISPTIGLSQQIDSANTNFSNNPFIIVLLTVLILVYVFATGTLGSGFKQGAKGAIPDMELQSVGPIEIFMWGIFIFLILMNGVQYFFGVDITASIKNLFTEKPQIDLTIVQDQPDPVAEMKAEKQVFHIPGNEYTFASRTPRYRISNRSRSCRINDKSRLRGAIKFNAR